MYMSEAGLKYTHTNKDYMPSTSCNVLILYIERLIVCSINQNWEHCAQTASEKIVQLICISYSGQDECRFE